MQSFLCSIFHVFNPRKWNGLETKPAYVTRLFNGFFSAVRESVFEMYRGKPLGLKKKRKKQKKKKKVEIIGNFRKIKNFLFFDRF